MSLIGVKTLNGDDTQEVIIISKNGQTIRLGLKDTPSIGRATQGVRIMRLSDDDRVVSLALVDKAEDIEEDDDQPTQTELVETTPAEPAESSEE